MGNIGGTEKQTAYEHWKDKQQYWLIKDEYRKLKEKPSNKDRVSWMSDMPQNVLLAGLQTSCTA